MYDWPEALENAVCSQGRETAASGQLWQSGRQQVIREERSQNKTRGPDLARELSQLRGEKSLAEARAQELAEELRQRDMEMEDLEKIFSESMSLQRRDLPGIGSCSAAAQQPVRDLGGSFQTLTE